MRNPQTPYAGRAGEAAAGRPWLRPLGGLLALLLAGGLAFSAPAENEASTLIDGGSATDGAATRDAVAAGDAAAGVHSDGGERGSDAGVTTRSALQPVDRSDGGEDHHAHCGGEQGNRIQRRVDWQPQHDAACDTTSWRRGCWQSVAKCLRCSARGPSPLLSR